MKLELSPTEVYDTFWRFASERQAVYFRRLVDPYGPWSDDPILNEYRFTNAYRVTDRVSQHLVRDVQYDPKRPDTRNELFFRTMLFKIFNRIETWELLERSLGPVNSETTPLHRISEVLDDHLSTGARIYSAAYIMPSPDFGHSRKHQNHLAMLDRMMHDDLPGKLAIASTLESAYKMFLQYPGLGPFLAFQYCIDLNYSVLMNFDEAEFVVAGPGALDGIAKCFHNADSTDPSTIIHWMVEHQEHEFDRLELQFHDLYGRPLQPIDCQNVFCEVSKYARIAHPEVLSQSGRTRIKQRYKPNLQPSPQQPFFPPKWHLDTSRRIEPPPISNVAGQQRLF
ncbi:MAG: hypothetical protein F4Y55_14015 [Gammaproteobacteria bacterium]|nr:hypothetical protein [Gammaproteobacteria bacterium]